MIFRFCCFFFFKQKTAYEMRISDWSSDVCSSDLPGIVIGSVAHTGDVGEARHQRLFDALSQGDIDHAATMATTAESQHHQTLGGNRFQRHPALVRRQLRIDFGIDHMTQTRSEEHTSELQSLMRISYAVFCLKKK